MSAKGEREQKRACRWRLRTPKGQQRNRPERDSNQGWTEPCSWFFIPRADQMHQQKAWSRAPQPFVILIPRVAISRALTFYCNYVQLYTLSMISSESQRNTRGRRLTMERVSAPILYDISEDSKFWNSKLVAVVVLFAILFELMA